MELLKPHLLFFSHVLLLSLGIWVEKNAESSYLPPEIILEIEKTDQLPNTALFTHSLADTCGNGLIGWKNMNFIFSENGCQSCHDDGAAGGLDLTSYVGAIMGGNKCKTDILIGDHLVNIITIDGYNGCGIPIAAPSMNQRAGGTIDNQELASIQAWIDAGAPEDCACRTDAPDSDGDGICDALDDCPNFDNNLIGTACDDSITCTINDVWTTNCKCEGTPIQTNCIEMEVSLFLEGPLQQDTMGSFLTPHIALVDPYLGLDSVASMPANIVDWIWIQVRDSVDNKQILAQRAFLLSSQGKVLSLNGDSKLSFNVSIPNHAFVAILHRNHLGIMTADPVDLTQPLDFSEPSTPVFGINSRKIINGKAVLIAGDANLDGTINAVDKNSYWRVQNGNPFNYGAGGGDMNLDGTINAVDKNAYWRLNNGLISQIPQ